MTKNELAEQVARQNGLSASQARQVMETTIEVVSNELAAGGEVALAGFGKFSVSHRAARLGRNPVHRPDDPHQRQQGGEVLGGQRAEEASEPLTPILRDPEATGSVADRWPLDAGSTIAEPDHPALAILRSFTATLRAP